MFVSMLFLTFAFSGNTKASSIIWHPVKTASFPHAIIPDPNGNGVWFGMNLLPEIGHMDTQGNVHYYPVGKAISDLARDTSGNIWFAFYKGGIGYRDRKGHITTFTASGRDLTYNEGKIWFLTGPHGYGSIAATCEAAFFSLPQDFSAHHVAAGPDGNIWITDQEHNTVGKVHPGSSLVTAYALPEKSMPDAITSGPDGALWFTEITGLGRITTGGKVAQYPNNINYLGLYGNITSGPGKSIVFVAGEAVNKMSIASGEATPISSLSGHGGDGNVTMSQGTIWFTDALGNRIGQVA